MTVTKEIDIVFNYVKKVTIMKTQKAKTNE